MKCADAARFVDPEVFNADAEVERVQIVDNMMMPELRVMQMWLLALMMLPGLSFGPVGCLRLQTRLRVSPDGSMSLCYLCMRNCRCRPGLLTTTPGDVEFSLIS
jgi:hypothetical protein